MYCTKEYACPNHRSQYKKYIQTFDMSVASMTIELGRFEDPLSISSRIWCVLLQRKCYSPSLDVSQPHCKLLVLWHVRQRRGQTQKCIAFLSAGVVGGKWCSSIRQLAANRCVSVYAISQIKLIGLPLSDCNRYTNMIIQLKL